MKLIKYLYDALMIKDKYYMKEFILYLIFIEIVIKNVASSIVYEGIGEVSILSFFFMKRF